ncbi:MAG: acyl-CoA reductase [Armatimonadota bacterium]
MNRSIPPAMDEPFVSAPGGGPSLAAWWRNWLADPAGTFPELSEGAGIRDAISATVAGIEGLLEIPPNGRTLLVVAAATTPLSAWPPILFALASGWTVVIRASRRAPEGVRALASSIVLAAPAWSGRLRVATADSEDITTTLSGVDAVVAYGSDHTLATIRRLAGQRPFLGFGHAVSIGVWRRGTILDAVRLWQDVLVHDQAGCLSPQAVFASRDSEQAAAMLALAGGQVADALGIAPRVDPAVVARLRDLREGLAVAGARVRGDATYRWTVVEPPAGWVLSGDAAFGVVTVVSTSNPAAARRALGALVGRVSGIGFTADHDAFAMREWDWIGASRWARMGELQTPPLEWRNGGVDIAVWLAEAARSRV